MVETLSHWHDVGKAWPLLIYNTQCHKLVTFIQNTALFYFLVQTVVVTTPAIRPNCNKDLSSGEGLKMNKHTNKLKLKQPNVMVLSIREAHRAADSLYAPWSQK